MPEPPQRWKDRADYDQDEMLREVQAVSRGQEPPRVETREYREYRSDALRAAGLTDEADASEPDKPVDIADMSPDDHYQAIRR